MMVSVSCFMKLVVLKYTLGLGKECQGLVGGLE